MLHSAIFLVTFEITKKVCSQNFIIQSKSKFYLILLFLFFNHLTDLFFQSLLFGEGGRGYKLGIIVALQISKV